MSLTTVCVDLDGSIPCMPRLARRLAAVVPLGAYGKDLRLWAHTRGLCDVRKALEAFRRDYPGPWLALLGSGDFHHITALLLETLPEPARPVTLVLLDNHPDWCAPWPPYHCGNWVSHVLTYPWVREVVLAGQDSADISGRNFWAAPFKHLCRGRVTLHPYSRSIIRVPLRWPKAVLGVRRSLRRLWGTELFMDTVSAVGADRFFRDLADGLRGASVYISVDLDCLAKAYACTEWDQGKLTLDEVSCGIRHLVRSGRVVGADLCGGRAPMPLSGVLKRLDAGRCFWRSDTDRIGDNLNEEAYLRLLDAFGMSSTGKAL